MGRMRSIKHLNTLPKDRKRSRSSSRSGSRRSVSASPRRFFASTPSSGAPGFPTPKSKPQRSFTEETAIKARQREALLHVLTAPGWGSIFGGVAAVFAVVGVTSLGVGVAWDHARAAADEERLERWLMQQGGDDHRQYEWIELEPGNHRRTAGGRRAMETLAGEGRGVWARIRGEGLPVVILDGSVGETSADFYKVEELVSAFTTCVSFDRPGLGLSSLPPPPGSDNPVPDISPPVASSGAQFVPDSDTVHDLAENLEDVASAIVDRLETRSRTMGRPTVVLVGQGTVGGLAAQCYESDQCERDQRKGGRRLSEDKCSPGGKVPPRVVGVVYLDPVVPGVQQEQEAAVPAVAAAVEQQRNNAEWCVLLLFRRFVIVFSTIIVSRKAIHSFDGSHHFRTARLVPTGITRLFGSTAAAHAQLLCDIPDHWPPQNKVNDSKRGIGDGMAEEELRIRTAEQRSGCKETNAKENGSRNPSERGRRERREPEDRPTLSTAAALRDTVEATRSRKRHRQTVAAELNMYLDGAKHLGSIPLALGGDNGGGDARDNIVPPPAIVLSHGRAVFEVGYICNE